MSNTDNAENQIRMHPSNIHIKNEYEYEFHIDGFSGYEYE
jgi:hypothetical protein